MPRMMASRPPIQIPDWEQPFTNVGICCGDSYSAKLRRNDFRDETLSRPGVTAAANGVLFVMRLLSGFIAPDPGHERRIRAAYSRHDDAQISQ